MRFDKCAVKSAGKADGFRPSTVIRKSTNEGLKGLYKQYALVILAFVLLHNIEHSSGEENRSLVSTNQGKDKVIATINGKDIFYNTIKADAKTLRISNWTKRLRRITACRYAS